MGVDEEFSAFVARAWPALVRSAVLLTGDQAAAEDLVQAALIRTHRRWRSILARDRPDGYVRQAVLNEYRSWWRRHGRRERLVDRVPDRPDRDCGPTEPSARQVALHQAMSELPARMRATLVLRFYEDLSEHQVAELLSCSVGTVKSQTSRGLVRLRAALAAVEEGGPRPAARATRPATRTRSL